MSIPDKIEQLSDSPLDFTIRYAKPYDWEAARLLLAQAGKAVSSRTLGRWMTQSLYDVRLVCRNGLYPVGVMVTKTVPEGTSILVLHVAPPYAGRGIEQVLLGLARTALPERPTTCAADMADGALCEALRDAKWSAVGVDRETDRITFRGSALDPR
jgi:hypothetical protein